MESVFSGQETGRKLQFEFPASRKLFSKFSDYSCVAIISENLKALRNQFDAEVARQGLSRETTTRYRSWIRRFIRYCRHIGVSINIESAQSFLQTYQSSTTRRQGYYAIKFLFVEAMRQPNFITLSAVNFPERRKKSRWRTWCGYDY